MRLLFITTALLAALTGCGSPTHTPPVRTPPPTTPPTASNPIDSDTTPTSGTPNTTPATAPVVTPPVAPPATAQAGMSFTTVNTNGTIGCNPQEIVSNGMVVIRPTDKSERGWEAWMVNGVNCGTGTLNKDLLVDLKGIPVLEGHITPVLSIRPTAPAMLKDEAAPGVKVSCNKTIGSGACAKKAVVIPSGPPVLLIRSGGDEYAVDLHKITTPPASS